LTCAPPQRSVRYRDLGFTSTWPLYTYILSTSTNSTSFLSGVTRTLNISYLRAIPIGTTVRIRSWVVSIGRTMAMIRSEMTSVDGKTIYATCEHHKVNADAKEEHKAIKTVWDEELESLAKGKL